MKFRGGMGLLGVLGKYGMYRFSNTLALLDSFVRGVGPDQAKGGRNWSNYTWHGDQAPGHPFVHGVQTSDCDFNDLRNSKLIVQVGKNLVENKRPDSHFFIECMERGARLVTIAPEYSPPATKCDYWIPVRPQSDAALFLGITRVMLEKGSYDAAFVKGFTDFPLLVRKDDAKRLKASDLFPDYKNRDLSGGVSMKVQGLTAEQREELGDQVVHDGKTGRFVAVSRDDVGDKLAARGIDPTLEGTWKIRLADGREIEVATLFTLYKDVHLKDYDLDTVCEITRAPRDLILRLASDFGTIKPVGIHVGEGINHWFHATEVNRATYLPLLLTGNIGKPGAGGYTWAGNYKSGLFQGAHDTGPGFKGWVGEDPFAPALDPKADVKSLPLRVTTQGEEPAYWNYGDKPLVVNTPKAGRKCFTGKGHMPTPTRFLWFTNVNLINNAKWAYEMVKNVDPMIECIVSTDIELNGTIEYSDIGLPASTWMEIQQPEITASCSNPFLQIWKGGLKPVYDTKDDVAILAESARRLGSEILAAGGSPKLAKLAADTWKFTLEGASEVYIDRLLSGSVPTSGYTYADVMAGKYGEPGMQCASCHGESGRGDGKAAPTLKDEAGFPIRPYDFMLPGRMKGGTVPEDVYRAFSTGLDGTPMPDFSQNLKPEERWQLVHFVRSLSTPAAPAAAEPGPIKAAGVAEVAADPADPAWASAPPTAVLVRPIWSRSDAPDRLLVRAMRSKTEIGLLVEWADGSKNERTLDSQDFRDALSIEFPVRPPAGPNSARPFLGMGDRDNPVNLWHWKADWQVDLARFAMVADAHPDMFVMTYHDVDKQKEFFTAWAAGNPMARRDRTSAVEDCNAMGLGTLTSQPAAGQQVTGKGVFADRGWRVVVKRALATPDPGDVQLDRVPSAPVAFAVWDGAKRDRNGQKLFSAWETLVLTP